MSNKMKEFGTIQIGPLMMALLMFFESTAGNLHVFAEKPAFYDIQTNNVTYNEQDFSSDTVPLNNDSEPSASIPQTGGPDQPEVQSFTPVGISDMVDPFTGDFSYNIPIMDVDGYPINLAYNGGANMDQEASWVGLGWNLNPGVMNRSLRGLPDDFNGTDSVRTEMNQKKNWNVGAGFGADFELLGLNLPDSILGSISANMSFDYDNFTGWSTSLSLSPNFKFKNPAKDRSLDAGLGFSGSNNAGATLSPSLGYATGTNPNSTDALRKLNIGSTLNSRQGLKVTGGFTKVQATSKNESQKTTAALSESNKKSKVNATYISLSSYNIGNVSFSPKIGIPISMYSTSFSFKFGTDLGGADPSLLISANYSSSWLKNKSISSPAFGYNYLGIGQHNDKAVLDFTRENEGAITKNTPALAIPCLTYDVFSASGHGIGGSYRPKRSEIGYVFDPKQHTMSNSDDVDLETNVGTIYKLGVNVNVNSMYTKSGIWKDNQNQAIDILGFNKNRIKYQEANELSVESEVNHFENIGGENAVAFEYSSYQGIKSKLITDKKNEFNSLSRATDEIKRNQLTYTLSNFEMKQGAGIEEMHPDNYAILRPEVDHHVGQFTVLNTEGSRYVYGIAAYNHFQSNVSFSVGDFDPNSNTYVDHARGMVKYEVGTDNSINNEKGTENYYNKETTPAYAHSYLLTTVLNSDYVDADMIKGPSPGDLGGYMKFDYDKIDNYQWRSPISGVGFANYEEGFHTDDNDDKGHYTFGEKELWYLKSIRSKNHIAIFHTSTRADGNAVDSNGTILNTGEVMMKLDSISLYSLPDYLANGNNAKPIKVAHFVYDYSLCKNFPLNNNTSSSNNGKLTLKKVFFTYEKSQKGRFSPYRFNYDYNPDYHSKSVDRWGVYKPYPNYNGVVQDDPLRPSDFPYVDFNKSAVDLYASAWNLTDILLPSGGKIEVQYESDDYAYVQHKRANQMFKIVGVEKHNGVDISENGDLSSLLFQNNPNAKLYFELLPKESGGFYTNVSDYLPEDSLVYFRALMRFHLDRFDFVPGYAKIDSFYITNLNGIPRGVIKFQPAQLKDHGQEIYNPIAVAAIQFGRLHLNKFIPPSNSIGDANEMNGLGDLANSVLGAVTSFSEYFTGPNAMLWAENIGTKLRIEKSWIRLQNPNQKKLGGGYRVKQVKIFDSWDTLTNNQMEAFSYGQEYLYDDGNDHSSGVAAYEPQAGGDENPFQQPVYFSKRHVLAPDEKNYQIKPYGEQFFPTAQVGYASVTIRNLKHSNVSRTATGKVVREFYTAKDFPTIVRKTELNSQPNRIKIPMYFFSYCVDQIVASQGFVVETNDMHGKPKGEYIYGENQTTPQSSVEYKYKSKTITYEGELVKHLVNEVTTISKNGEVNSNSRIGLQYDAVADFRKSLSQTANGAIELNVNFEAPFIVLPNGFLQLKYERTAMRSATFTKVIERFGLLDTTIATDDKSIVRTENLAYDSQTGAVILTKTQTDFNDAIYNLTVPAHWYYDRMGQAYKNIDNVLLADLTINSGIIPMVNSTYVRGDELMLTDANGVQSMAWVTDVGSNGVFIQRKDGSFVNGIFKEIRVIRSGRRNIQMTPIGSITMRSNPLTTFSSNLYDQVLQASAVEYSEDWRTFCDCFSGNDSTHLTSNPFVRGTEGTWRPLTSYVHLTDRTQSYVNQNSNIRDDGFMTSFTPFYKLENQVWNMDKKNWTFTSKVSEFSPFGQALETVDPLNRYSSSLFGYNQTLATAIAVNARYRQIGFDGFEDYDFQNCSDNHFRIAAPYMNKLSNQAHTGKYSIKVSASDNVVFTKIIETGCEVISCNLSKRDDLITNTNGSTTQTVSFSGGLAPYQMEIELMNGSPIYQLNENGNGLIIPNASSAYTLLIKVTDAQGCIKNFQINR
ncbi:MAG: hypothetical protein RIS20_1207 [Bacteroidota bacterium]|jgi:hypothetical protein